MPHFQGAKQRKGRDLNIYCRLKGTINHPENAGKILALRIYSINIHILYTWKKRDHTQSTFHTANGLLLPILSQCIIQ